MSQDQKQVGDAHLEPAQPTNPAQPLPATLSSTPVVDEQVNISSSSPSPAAGPGNSCPAPHIDQEPPAYVEATSKLAPENNIAMVTPLHMLTEQPGLWIDCQHCKQRTQTKVFTEGEPMQFILGAVLCLVCICLTCVPCCAGWFERTNISCARCNKLVAVIPYDGPIRVMPTVEQTLQPTQHATHPKAQEPMVATPQH